jgi:hypothetical protein
MLNLSLAVFNLVEGCSFVRIFDSVTEHPVRFCAGGGQ